MSSTVATSTFNAIDPIGQQPSTLARELERRILQLDQETDCRYAFEYCCGSDWQQTGKDDSPIRDRMRWIAVWPVTGGSEGHYIHVDAVYQSDSKGLPIRDAAGRFVNYHRPIVVVKIFGGWPAAAELAGIIGEWLQA